MTPPTAATPTPDGVDDLTFSFATAADVDAVTALVQSAYRGAPSRQGWTTEADLIDGQRIDAATLGEVLDRPDTDVVLAHRDGALVACCELRRRPERDQAQLGMFAVDPTGQGRGIGRAVLAEAERMARDRWGVHQLVLHVIDLRHDLIAWYGRRGYTPTGEHEPFPYGDDRFGVPRRPDLRLAVLAKPLRRLTRWETDTGENHSEWYVERFRTMAAEGADLVGEARLVHALVPPRSRLLDAGCGPGRVGGELHALGHRVVGVDVDPVLVAAAEADHPGPRWMVGDLAHLDLAPRGEVEPFDGAVLAGNVLAFVAPDSEPDVLRRVAAHVRPDGPVVVGFHVERLALAEFDAAVAAAGLELEHRFATWDLRRWHDDADFAVSVLRT
jgi:ribosomal protein S18 acetylase RimI-like enzyme/2-polyprenyl-3-methyl-5-hydroxy-6-metoxy-1,4-benzoquinol methylase